MAANSVLLAFQALLVALTGAGIPPWLERLAGRGWALILPVSIAAVVGGIELFPQLADGLTWIALILVPPGAALALGWALHGARPPFALDRRRAVRVRVGADRNAGGRRGRRAPDRAQRRHARPPAGRRRPGPLAEGRDRRDGGDRRDPRLRQPAAGPERRAQRRDPGPRRCRSCSTSTCTTRAWATATCSSRACSAACSRPSAARQWPVARARLRALGAVGPAVPAGLDQYAPGDRADRRRPAPRREPTHGLPAAALASQRRADPRPGAGQAARARRRDARRLPLRDAGLPRADRLLARDQRGMVVSHIYVDDEQSLGGGRDIWGLPKELAEFEFTPTHFAARQDGTTLLEATIRRRPGKLPLMIPAPIVSDAGTTLGYARIKAAPALVTLRRPAEQPVRRPRPLRHPARHSPATTCGSRCRRLARKVFSAEMRHNLRPLFDRVVVKELEPDRIRQSGLLVPSGSHEPPPQHGIVLAVGPGLDWWEQAGHPDAGQARRPRRLPGLRGRVGRGRRGAPARLPRRRAARRARVRVGGRRGVSELADGLWRWTARHPDWHPSGEFGAEVGSYAAHEGGRTVLIDPLLSDETIAALDEIVTGEVVVAITITYHVRDSAAAVGALGRRGQRAPGRRSAGCRRARRSIPTRTCAGTRSSAARNDRSSCPACARWRSATGSSASTAACATGRSNKITEARSAFFHRRADLRPARRRLRPRARHPRRAGAATAAGARGRTGRRALVSPPVMSDHVYKSSRSPAPPRRDPAGDRQRAGQGGRRCATSTGSRSSASAAGSDGRRTTR